MACTLKSYQNKGFCSAEVGGLHLAIFLLLAFSEVSDFIIDRLQNRTTTKQGNLLLYFNILKIALISICKLTSSLQKMAC